MARKLILLAHGSKHPEWTKPFEKLKSKLQKKLGRNNVFLAYIEHPKYSLINTLSKEVKNSENDITILPLFMSEGNHTKKDIPNTIKKISKKSSNLKIKILKPIGINNQVVELMYKIALESI